MNNKFNEIYECLIEYTELDNTKLDKIFLSYGDYYTGDSKVCRFCGKAEPEVEFKKLAHAISESIGNKRLFLIDECDSCNYSFGSTYEDSFGKFTQPFRMTSQIYGKKNKLKYKTPNGSSMEVRKSSSPLPEISNNVRALIIDTVDNHIMKPYPDGNGFELTLKRQKYEPMYVYQSLLKMALSIMKKEDFLKYIKTAVLLTHIFDEDVPSEVKRDYFEGSPNIGFCEFIPGLNPFGSVGVCLYKKRSIEKYKDYVDSYFVLYFNNHSLQIPLVSDNEYDKEVIFTPKYHSMQSTIKEVDFTKFESEFICSFKGDKIVFDRSDFQSLEEILRKNGKLNTPSE